MRNTAHTLDRILENSVIVVAHPDDEVLWFSSILERVKHIIFCYDAVPGNRSLTDARKAMAITYPLANVSYLGIDETGSLNCACWDDPIISAYGLELKVHHPSLARYEVGFPELARKLSTELAPYNTVFTHNPWGEYGHEEHVQIHRAVQAAQALLGFECWHPAYVSAKSYLLMSRYNFDDACSVTADIDLVMKNKFIDLYMKHRAWTWFRDLEKDDTEVFYNNITLRENELSESKIPHLALVKINIEMAFRSHNKISKKILITFADQLIPKIYDRYILINTDNQFTLSEPETNTKTILSDTAAVILGLCDGTKTVSLVVECLCSLYEMEPNDIKEDIYDSLIEFNIRTITALSINAN